MPADIPNPFPDVDSEEIAAIKAATTREQFAARLIATRGFGPSIPKTAFIRGASDHSPMMKGIVDLVTVCWRIVDVVNDSSLSDEDRIRAYGTHADDLADMLENHGVLKEDITPA